MTRIKALRITATVATSLGLVGGFAGIAGASPWNNNRDHDNRGGNASTTNVQKTSNDTDVNATNNNPQYAVSGEVNSDAGHSYGNWWNNRGNNNSGNSSDATSGDASNKSSLDATVTVSNTAPDSNSTDAVTASNSKHGNTTVKNIDLTENNTNVNLTNNNSQVAKTGDVNVSGNRVSGSATSGDASNTSSATFNVTVKSQ